MNGIVQGSFAAALASSINIGTAVDEITKGEVTANIGKMQLNSLIFQDDIAKMNFTLEDARDVGRMLESKQMRANTSKSKYVIMAPPAPLGWQVSAGAGFPLTKNLLKIL